MSKVGGWKLLCLIFSFCCITHCRKHHLKLENDERRVIHITTFGFLKGGYLEVNLQRFSIRPNSNDFNVGFTVDRTQNNGVNPYQYMDATCSDDFAAMSESVTNIRFLMHFKENITKTHCSSELQHSVKICKTSACVSRRPAVIREEIEVPNNMMTKQKRDVGSYNSQIKETDIDFIDPALLPEREGQRNNCANRHLPMDMIQMPDGTYSFSMNFVVYIAAEDSEGLYSLYFHNCAPDDMDSRVNLDMKIIESNQNDFVGGKNYLSAGESTLPALYLMMSILFLIAGCFWILTLGKSLSVLFIMHKTTPKDGLSKLFYFVTSCSRDADITVFKLHYLMGILVFVKSLSLLLHSINYHYIQKYGEHCDGWAVLHNIANLLKGVLFFVTILLIGTGYEFVKKFLSIKEKTIFMIVISLQVLANVAQIILAKNDEGEIPYTIWKLILISADFICCGAIIFPVIWSIRHFQEASQTGGERAASLKMLKLFRHYYIMIVAYIFFSRIIVQMLLRVILPFRYEWVSDMFLELTTLSFFVMTAYTFRPTKNNPSLIESDSLVTKAIKNSLLVNHGKHSGEQAGVHSFQSQTFTKPNKPT